MVSGVIILRIGGKFKVGGVLWAKDPGERPGDEDACFGSCQERTIFPAGAARNLEIFRWEFLKRLDFSVDRR